MQATLDLKKYSALMIELAFLGCKVVEQLGNDPNLQKFQKKKNDPVTVADYKIQTMIVRTLRHHFPGLAIVGEQSTQFKGVLHFDESKVPQREIPAAWDNSLPLSDFTVFIDPIDGTKSFIKKDFYSVTVLIGLAYKEKAYLGIIGAPYKMKEGKAVFDPSVYIGGGKEAWVIDSDNKWVGLTQQPLQQPLRLVSRKQQKDPVLFEKVKEYMKAQFISLSGSGRKNLMVLNGDADIHIYFGRMTSLWDTCAGDGIFRAMGGTFLLLDGRDIPYCREDRNKSNYTNEDGIICCFDEQLARRVIQIVNKND